MCGIVGTVRIGDLELVRRMTDMLAYRGPDDSGFHASGDVCLGHRRLAILDLSEAGRQPMATDDGALVITFNGEIYNYRELRDELERNGHRFRTATDTETLLLAYRQWGTAFLERIEGIFAFGLWDDRAGTLLLARDRPGVKPLFWHRPEGARHDGGIAFASELKVMRLLPGFRSRVNREALRSAMRFACNVEDESMLASVHKLPPGHWLKWRGGAIEWGPYWSRPAPLRGRAARSAGDEESLAAELRATLGRVVRSQMVSDAPLGAALSGGLDSSGIVALMAQSGARVDTFTVGHGPDDPDLLNARIVAEHCDVRHHEILVEGADVAALAPRVLWYLEEPLGQMETVQMFLNYREAAKHVKVLLVGEGADECFAGYDRYALFDGRLPLPMATRAALYDRVYMYADEPPREPLARLLASRLGALAPSPLPDPMPRAAGPDFAGLDRHEALAHALDVDQRTYLHHLSLKRADAMGMAHSIELRVPFLGREVVELAARIPPRLMRKGGVEKHLLRRALAPLLPAQVVERRKRPFQMALNRGLVDALDLLCDTLLDPASVRERGFFTPEGVARLRRGRPGRRAPPISHKVWSYRVWAMILCELWARLFLDRPPEVGAPEQVAELANPSSNLRTNLLVS